MKIDWKEFTECCFYDTTDEPYDREFIEKIFRLKRTNTIQQYYNLFANIYDQGFHEGIKQGEKEGLLLWSEPIDPLTKDSLLKRKLDVAFQIYSQVFDTDEFASGHYSAIIKDIYEKRKADEGVPSEFYFFKQIMKYDVIYHLDTYDYSTIGYLFDGVKWYSFMDYLCAEFKKCKDIDYPRDDYLEQAKKLEGHISKKDWEDKEIARENEEFSHETSSLSLEESVKLAKEVVKKFYPELEKDLPLQPWFHHSSMATNYSWYYLKFGKVQGKRIEIELIYTDNVGYIDVDGKINNFKWSDDYTITPDLESDKEDEEDLEEANKRIQERGISGRL